MIVIVCLDDKGGMMFNHRRQSRDKSLCAQILRLTKHSILHMSHYSDVLKRGKRFHRHSNFEMQPHTFSGRVFWSAESITLPPFVPPNGTVRIVWNGKRWSESPI